MAFCSAAGIEPECISEATFSSFRQHLETTLLKNPMGAFREAVRAWNAARAEIAGWPDLAVSVPSRRKIWTQPWDSFPESLRRDVTAYLDRLAGRDPFEEVAFRPVRPLTLRNREYQLRQFASALVLSGRDPATLTNLGDLVTIEAFKDGLRFLLGRRANKPSGGIADLATGLKAIARHHVRADERHLAQMSAIIRRLQRPRSGLTENWYPFH